MKNVKKIKTTGIYIITNIKNGKIYVGSTKNFEKRFYYHINSLKNNKHSNQHLQHAFNLDGEKSFIYSLLENCKDEILVEREEYYIDILKASNDKIGYNINLKGDRPPSWLGKKHKDETKEKIRLSNIGKICSEHTKEVASETHKGKKLSNEQIIFLKERSTGDKNPMFGKSVYDVWLEKYGKDDADKKLEDLKLKKSKNKFMYCGWLEKYGKDEADKKLEDWKLKLSKNRKNIKMSDETKLKLSILRKGKIASEETKRKMSEKRKGELNPSCKINNMEVNSIIKMIENGIGVTEISKIYNVSRRTIYNIKNKIRIN